MSKLVVLPPPVVPVPADQVIVVDELVTEGYRDIPLHLVRISYTNRTRFNAEALQQLADNIAEVGILQPILMRPVTPTAEAPQILEVVAGERRFRAAVMAGLFKAPSSIKHLSDKQAAEIQLLENIQRENPHPLEEAIGFEQLMLKHGYNADQLAAKVKQSRSYVYARLKLCALSLRARELFLDDIQRFSASTALLIARIPTPGLQDKALSEIMAPQYNGEPMSVRLAAQHIANRYTLNLEAAPFDTKDAKLLAGADNCLKCPKRTGNQPEIYADAKSADVCTDPDCFAEKKAAHYQRIIVIANKKRIPVLEGEEADDATPNNWSRDEEFVTEDHHLSAFDRVAPTTGMSGPIKKHLASELLPAPVKYLKNEDGSVDALYRREDIQAALEKAGACETEQARTTRLGDEAADPSKAAKQTKQQEAAAKQAQEREERQRRCEAITQERVIRYRKLRARAAAGLTLPMLRELTKALVLDSHDHSLPDDLIGDLYPFQERSDAALCAHIDLADMATVQLLLMDLIVGENLSMSTWDLDDDPSPTALAMLAMAKTEGIDVTPADLAIANIDIETLQYPDDVRETISANIEHLAAVCAHIIDKAPYHLGNVEAAANSLGYAYGSGGWYKQAAQVEETAATADDAAATHMDQSEPMPAPTRTKLSLKKKNDAQPDAAAGPVVRVKKDRAAQAAAALTPAAAWPFPTQHRS
jgi:ParB/RepB/Spo0J family partition protein